VGSDDWFTGLIITLWFVAMLLLIGIAWLVERG